MALQFFGNAYKTFIQLINSVLVLMYVHLCHQFLQPIHLFVEGMLQLERNRLVSNLGLPG